MGYREEWKTGSTGELITVGLRSSTNGNLAGGRAFDAVTAYYIRDGADAVAIAMQPMTLNSWVSGGWAETGRAGEYQFGVPNAALVGGAKGGVIVFSASGVIDYEYNYLLVAVDTRDGAAFGLSSVAFVEASIGELTEDDGSGNLRYTQKALEESPAGSGGGLTAQQVRDAMKLAPTAGDPAAGSVDEELDAILAKPVGGGGGVAIVGPTRQQIEEIVRLVTAAVWQAKNRTLTAPVRIEGAKKTLDDLNDVSRETVRGEVDESNAEQAVGILGAIGQLETREAAAARAGRVGGAAALRFDEIDAGIRDVRATAERAEQVAGGARVAAENAATRELPAGITRADVREEIAAARAEIRGDAERLHGDILAFEGNAEKRHAELVGAADASTEARAALLATLEADRDRTAAHLATIEARIIATTTDLAAASAVVEKTDERAKALAGGLMRVLEIVGAAKPSPGRR